MKTIRPLSTRTTFGGCRIASFLRKSLGVRFIALLVLHFEELGVPSVWRFHGMHPGF